MILAAKTLRPLLWAVALAMLLALPTSAQNILKGLDFWRTPSGGAELSLDIPADFFCSGSPAMVDRRLVFKGKPLTASRDLKDTDTVLDRPNDAVFSGSVATTPVLIRALSLVSTTNLSVNCGGITTLWRAKITLQPGVAQPLGTMTIRRNSSSGGTFDADFHVKAQVEFINAADSTDTRGPINRQDRIRTGGACWSYTPNSNHVQCSGSLSVDTDCDLTTDLTLPRCTSNFFPGGTGCNGIGGGPTGGTTHEGPHKKTKPPVAPPPPPPPPPGGGGGDCEATNDSLASLELCEGEVVEPDLVSNCCCQAEGDLLRQVLIPGVGFLIDESVRSSLALRASSKEHARIMLRRLEDCVELIGPFLLKEAEEDSADGKPARVSRPRR